MTKSSFDSLIYIDDYIDIVESLQIDLQKNFTLLKEMDGYAQESTSLTAKAAIDLIDNIDCLDANDRFIKLKGLTQLLEETVQRSSEKAALAKVTSDAVDRHCNRLDADLVKFEENHPAGSVRITSLPGLTPSSRNLREYSKLTTKEKITKKINEKRESQSAKKRRAVKEEFDNPRSAKEPKNNRASQHSNVDKGKQQQQQHQQQQQQQPPQQQQRQIKTLPSRKNSGKLKPSESDVDPDEILYCYCSQISYGEMVACDNADCDIEWFHIACVDLKAAPKGKWYCDNCSKYKGKQRRS